jgi:2-C-methyl-D-erythritol 2,4-cyclodiphosphate synthase
MIKIGIGYDLHRLEPGRILFLGGVEIPHPRGLAGHSDGDCLIHAVIDALLGAEGETDIGRLFPDTDAATEGVRSTIFLGEVVNRLRRKGFRVVHVDVVVVAEHPKLGPHFPRMKEVLAPLLGVDGAGLGLKAKTNEGVGLIGREEAVACWAVALIEKTRRRNPDPVLT